MAETLCAILLATSSANGSHLVYRWPPSPLVSPRLSRPRIPGPPQPDNPWSAARSSESIVTVGAPSFLNDDGENYEWKRPNARYPTRDRSVSHSTTHPNSGRNSPSAADSYDVENHAIKDHYDDLFGYSSEFLAGQLCPHRSLCHQKFELIVDDLAFVGHPVCAETNGVWQFKPEKSKSNTRGRGSRNRELSQLDETPPESRGESPGVERAPPTQCAWLHTFHFVMVLDLPDPSSSASGNISKYFDIIYEQIAFTFTAVLFQEQVLSNFVEAECDTLGTLKDECFAKGTPFLDFMAQALEVSSIAPAMKTLYEAIKTSSIAYITIHGLPLELQLPPHLDSLLHTAGELEIDVLNHPDDDLDVTTWGRDMDFGWRLPALSPWKSLLLLDPPKLSEPYMDLRGPQIGNEDRTLAEGLIKFLETASVTLSLADMGSLLDWDLETQVFPTVRWLVLHRRAKVVDIVHASLKTVFTLPPKFDQQLSTLSNEFQKDFTHPFVLPLPKILSTISTSTSKQSDNHFFATVVQSKDLIPVYHDVVLWMLKRDLLITLHLRIRVVATQDLKMRVRVARERAASEKSKLEGRRVRRRKQLDEGEDDCLEEAKHSLSGGMAWLSMSPKSARKHSRRVPSIDSDGNQRSDLNGSVFTDDEESESGDDEDDEDDEAESEEESNGVDWDATENLWPTMISDPGRATPLQRRWLSAMSEGKDPVISQRFEQINQYFDGKKSDDEILFRAEISRKQLREVLHHYDEYLQTFLHPS